jgi:hypothetical protein
VQFDVTTLVLGFEGTGVARHDVPRGWPPPPGGRHAEGSIAGLVGVEGIDAPSGTRYRSIRVTVLPAVDFNNEG